MVLPAQLRLRGYKCFDYLYKQGNRYYGSAMILRVVISKPKLLKSTSSKINKKLLKCAVSISHKVSKKAVVRNKLRRLLHEHLKARLNNSQDEYWALITLKPDSSVKTVEFLLKECDKLLFKAGLLKS
tara:strand:- start:1176 stop:1559 length:384 start_codon:yes stop_codon:yes gene_type:complete